MRAVFSYLSIERDKKTQPEINDQNSTKNIKFHILKNRKNVRDIGNLLLVPSRGLPLLLQYYHFEWRLQGLRRIYKLNQILNEHFAVKYDPVMLNWEIGGKSYGSI